MDGPQIAFVVMAVLDIPVFIGIGKVLFGSWGDFWEAVRFWLTPDILSLFAGEYGDDLWAELKLGFFTVLCGGCVWGELLLVAKWFGQTAGVN